MARRASKRTQKITLDEYTPNPPEGEMVFEQRSEGMGMGLMILGWRRHHPSIARWSSQAMADPDRVWLVPTTPPTPYTSTTYEIVIASILEAEPEWWLVMGTGTDHEEPWPAPSAESNPLAISGAYALVELAAAVRLGAERSMKRYYVSHADEFEPEPPAR